MIPPFGDVLWISGKPLESDTLTEASKAAVFGALGGASSAALFGWWVSSPSGIVASKAWSSSLLYSGLLGSFSLTLHTVAKARGKDDSLNTVAAGAVTGALFGLTKKSLYRMAAHSIGLAAVLGTADYCYQEIAEDYPSRPGDLEKMRSETVKWPRKDPFAARWEQIQKKASEQEA